MELCADITTVNEDGLLTPTDSPRILDYNINTLKEEKKAVTLSIISGIYIVEKLL
jgi:hypothetical protein